LIDIPDNRTFFVKNLTPFIQREEFSMETYDAIIIGSGMGGLTAASLLAQLQGKRVLVLERHFTFGGFTHVFSRKGLTWDVGIHYVGNMGDGMASRRMMDLVTGHAVQWQQMPERFDHFVYPDFSYDVPSDASLYEQELIARFPLEAAGIRRYFRDIKRLAKWLGTEMWSWGAPAAIQIPLRLATTRLRALGSMTTKAYLDRTFRDPRLKALLASQWGDYGLQPSESAFAYHAIVVQSYFRGAWYPVGGGAALADAIVPIITQYGGACLVNHTVTEILVENGAVVGVRAEHHQGRHVTAKVYRTPLVISDAGAAITYAELLPPAWRDQRSDLASAEVAPWSMISLYLGLQDSPAALGFTGANIWLFPGYDHDDSGPLQREDGSAAMLYLSFPSLKDPGASEHTMEILMPIRYDRFAAWRETTWMRRGADYEHLKDQITERILAKVEAHYPGLRNLVAYQEVATPLTVEEFTGNSKGAIYGMPATPHRLRARIGAANTPVKGLLLAGADACVLGIEGAMMGGVFAVAATMGLRGFPELLRQAATRDTAAQPKRAPVVAETPVVESIPVPGH
jgi:phytoene dehydrogenase-like protein